LSQHSLSTSSDARLLMAFMPYPRGGSSFVVRELATRLARRLPDPTLVTGSFSGIDGGLSDAKLFFKAVGRLVVVDYLATGSDDPLRIPSPVMHPSFEHKGDTPDHVLSAYSPRAGRTFMEIWAQAFRKAEQVREGGHQIYHLHHLGPMNTALRSLTAAPIIAHLHGTELKFAMDARDVANGFGKWAGHPAWKYADYWYDQISRSAQDAARVVCTTSADAGHAEELLHVDPARIKIVDNGVDTDYFAPLQLDPESILSNWQKWLVEEPRGWGANSNPGAVAYTRAQVRSAFLDHDGRMRPIFLAVKRFLAWKRITDLIDAYQLARTEYSVRAPLVIWGGFPGEYEEPHPYDYTVEKRVPGVFFTGWRGPEDLQLGYNCATTLINSADAEPFGTAILQAMSSGVPIISSRSGGPLQYLVDEGRNQNGWFFEPYDVRRLAACLAESEKASHDRLSLMGISARETVLARYSWESVVSQLHKMYDDVLREAR
jgi:glycosyltransferase involved in cell wall biosynthesis